MQLLPPQLFLCSSLVPGDDLGPHSASEPCTSGSHPNPPSPLPAFKNNYHVFWRAHVQYQGLQVNRVTAVY